MNLGFNDLLEIALAISANGLGLFLLGKLSSVAGKAAQSEQGVELIGTVRQTVGRVADLRDRVAVKADTVAEAIAEVMDGVDFLQTTGDLPADVKAELTPYFQKLDALVK